MRVYLLMEWIEDEQGRGYSLPQGEQYVLTNPQEDGPAMSASSKAGRRGVVDALKAAREFIEHGIDDGFGSEASDNGEDAIWVNWKQREKVLKQIDAVLVSVAQAEHRQGEERSK